MKRHPRTEHVRSRTRCGAYFFLLPTLLVYSVFVLVPVGESFRLSFYNWPSAVAQPQFAGFRNFTALVHDAVFWSALWHNAALVVMSLVVQLPAGLFLAVLLSYPTRARWLFRTSLFAPMIMPTTAIAVLWSYIYMPESGLLDRILQWFEPGFARGWLAEPETAMLCVFLTICWRFIGFHMVLFMAGIAALPDEVYDAARIDGAGEWQIGWHVTIPLLAPTIRVAAILSVIGSLKYFDLVYMLAAGAPERSRELLATYIYRLAFAGGQGRYGYASAVAVVLFCAAFIVAAAVHLAGERRAQAAASSAE